MNTTPTSTWQSKLRALGPGVLLASAAVGGSNIIASTQAGAIYGRQLGIITILVNLFKYPFFRFGTQYTLDTGKSLLQGYKEEHPAYLLWLFLLLNLFTTVLNIAGVGLITAAILSLVAPGISMDVLAGAILGATLLLLITGRYNALDRLSKLVMIGLTAATVAAVVISVAKGGTPPAPGFVAPSPWKWDVKTVGFMIALMGWMPAPLEFSAINSIWVVVKRSLTPDVSYRDGLFDFHVGYISTAVLALFFMALGALVQFGSGEVVEMAGARYIAQLVHHVRPCYWRMVALSGHFHRLYVHVRHHAHGGRRLLARQQRGPAPASGKKLQQPRAKCLGHHWLRQRHAGYSFFQGSAGTHAGTGHDHGISKRTAVCLVETAAGP